MLNRLMVVAVLATMACGEDVPSCQVAWQHFYSSGCALFDPQSGTPIPVGTAIAQCQGSRASEPQCLSELDDLQSCVGGVPDGASNEQCIACSDEIDAVLTCQQ